MPLSQIQLSEASGRRNLIINGAMQIFQRATAATAAGTSYSTVDRFKPDTSTDGAFTTEKSTDNPFGTGSSLKAQVTTADTSLAATQYARILQNIEAQNLQHLLYGTSSAKTLTLSFWVKSSKTGIYSITLRKPDNTAYHFTHEYTISSANTWEKKVITITPTAGSTSFITASAGAIANDTGLGLELSFALGQGSTYAIGTSNTWSSNTATYASSNQVNWMDNTSNNFYLTQVQLETDSLTEFEHRSFAEELELCKRYFERIDSLSSSSSIIGVGFQYNNDPQSIYESKFTEKRATPSLAVSNVSHLQRIRAGTSGVNSNITGLSFNVTNKIGTLHDVSSQTNNLGDGCYLRFQNTSGTLDYDAEL